MRVVCALVAALVFLATSHALSLAPSTERGPVVLWSGTDALVAKGAQCFEPVETAHLVAVSASRQREVHHDVSRLYRRSMRWRV